MKLSALMACLAILAGCNNKPTAYQEKNLERLQSAEGSDLIVCGHPDRPDTMALLVSSNYHNTRKNVWAGISGRLYRKSSVEFLHGIPYGEFNGCEVRILKSNEAEFPSIIGNIVYEPFK